MATESTQTIYQRFIGGVTDVASNDPMASLGIIDPTKYAVFFDDFTQLDTADYPADSDGVAKLYTVALDAELDYDVSFGGTTGAIIFTTEGGDTEGGQFSTTASPFKLTAGKKAFFECKFNTTAGAGTIGQESFFFGLATKQASTNFIDDAGTALAVDNAWGFVTFDAEAGVDAVVRASDEQSVSTDLHTLVSGTEYVYSVYYDGVDSHFYVDGVFKATITGTHPTAAIGPMVHYKSQEAAVKVLTLDYLFAAVER